MSYRIDMSEPLPDEVARIGHNRLGKAIAAVDVALDAVGHPQRENELAAAVYVMRRRGKQVRALVALVDTGQPEMRLVAKHVRNAGKAVGPLRDARAMAVARDRVEALIGISDLDLPSSMSADDQRDRLQQARRRLVKADRHLSKWRVGDGFDALTPGLRRTYRDGRRLLGPLREYPAHGATSVEAAHEWRRAVKVLRYQLRLLIDVAPSQVGALLDDLDVINDVLGADHDLWLVSQLLDDPIHAATMDRHHAELQERACAIGGYVYAEAPRAFAKRIEAYAKLE